MSDLHAGPAGIMGCPHIAAAPQSGPRTYPTNQAGSAFRGNFTDCGLFHLAVILSRSLPQKWTLYVSKAHSALSSLLKAFFHLTQHFQHLGSRPAAASDLWCPSGYPDSENSSFLLPRAVSSGGMEHTSDLSEGSWESNCHCLTPCTGLRMWH